MKNQLENAILNLESDNNKYIIFMYEGKEYCYNLQECRGELNKLA